MRALRLGNRGSPKGDLEANTRSQKNSANIMELEILKLSYRGYSLDYI
jgi:hypothetical protein